MTMIVVYSAQFQFVLTTIKHTFTNIKAKTFLEQPLNSE